MVMTTMVIIIPPPPPPLAARGSPTIDEVSPGRPRGRCPPGRVLAPGSGLEHRVNYSVFYGQ